MRFSPWKIGKYTRWASCWDQYSCVSAISEDCHLCTKISKRRTIMQATVLTLYASTDVKISLHHTYFSFLAMQNREGHCWNNGKEIYMRGKSCCCSMRDHVFYGSTGCQFFKRGVQSWKDFCLKIDIPKGNYWILRIGLMERCQKSGIILVIKWFKN